MLGLLFSTCSAYSTTPQQALQQPDPTETALLDASKQALARTVLTELGTAAQYDLYLGNSVDVSVQTTQGAGFREWLHGVFVQEVGWSHAEEHYLSQLEANFSEAELEELLNLAQNPLFQKFLQVEAQSYGDAGDERRRLLEGVWEDYNSGAINPPPEVLR
ncbi:hypothetical protein H6G89_12890 [Oscillatoria sp. FACHB-1407]|uniref:hypothetical protein n=1 Tax=Oscillatoria sp. FACHB-1407 TaxID=2692847 RepID=UPI001684C34B|nr:hypothetical protein [Oscillatoria sp. FACHB-1407]MBD2461943.1 hypothetical protein [Oscillatoria sp. FACHB-1407]